jgi:penicillin-binding protein 1C
VVELTEAMGPARVLVALDRAGVGYRLPPGEAGLAITLGGIGVSLQDMVQLYAALARGGVALPLRWRLEGEAAEGARVVTRTSAWQVGDVLAGLAPPPGSPENRLAYKTGTSYGHRDAWAIGYDGRHVVGVWLGRADGTPVPGVFGADLAAPVLFQAFARVKPALEPQPPAPPETLLVANAQLPQPLQRFRSRGAAFEVARDAPAVAFPPDGAEVERLPEGVMVRVEGGKAPFTWLADGSPIVTGERSREVVLPLLGAGFTTLSVIDAEGRSARARVRLR